MLGLFSFAKLKFFPYQVILMSGISCEALNELCLEKDTDERIVHFNNILKFAVLKKDRSFLAIGGPSHVTLDGDPQVNDSSLIQTAIRCGTFVLIHYVHFLLFAEGIFVGHIYNLLLY